ncbi:MAG: hypothetical protein PVF17_01410 [Ignavibacteria bacterium]|jgi:hypothetical protein
MQNTEKLFGQLEQLMSGLPNQKVSENQKLIDEIIKTHLEYVKNLDPKTCQDEDFYPLSILSNIRGNL